MVRGVGQQFSGRYYVERVLHTITGDGTWTQQLHAAPQRHRPDRAGELQERRCARVLIRPPSVRSGHDVAPAGRRQPQRARPRATTASTAAPSPTTRTRAARAGSRSRCPRSSPTSTAAGRCRARRTPATRPARTPCRRSAPACGSSSRRATCRGRSGSAAGGRATSCPTDEGGTKATPDVKIIRSEQGLMLALHDDSQTIALSDSNGSNILKIEVAGGHGHPQGRRPRSSSTRRQIELVANAIAPGGVRRQLHDLPQPARADVQHAHAPGPDGRAVPGHADAADAPRHAADARDRCRRR